MTVVVIIFMIIATIFALASLGYVTVDVVMEVAATKNAEPVVHQPPVVVAPVVVAPEPEPEPEIEIVEHIDAEEADSMISDDLAMASAVYESGAGSGKQGIINIGVIDQSFEPNDVVTLAELKQKGLVPKNVGRLKVLVGGEKEGWHNFNVEMERFSSRRSGTDSCTKAAPFTASSRLSV
jgi:hypothetical protein